MPAPPVFPKSGSLIQPAKRTLAAVTAAANTVCGTSHAVAIVAMGGVAKVAGAIFAAIQAANLCTIAAVLSIMTAMMQLMGMMKQMATADWNAVYAILAKLT